MARTKDLIDAAKDMKEKGKGCCVQELSVVDVPLEKVHILALSNDDSTLAVTLSHSPMVHFFSVNMLLDKVHYANYIFCKRIQLMSLDELFSLFNTVLMFAECKTIFLLFG